MQALQFFGPGRFLGLKKSNFLKINLILPTDKDTTLKRVHSILQRSHCSFLDTSEILLSKCSQLSAYKIAAYKKRLLCCLLDVYNGDVICILDDITSNITSSDNTSYLYPYQRVDPMILCYEFQ